MNWERKNDQLAAIQAAQREKVLKIQKLLFGAKPCAFHKKKASTIHSFTIPLVRKKKKVPEKTVQKGTFKSYEGFIEALKRRGYVYLGSGAFSTVYAKPESDRVIKITYRPDDWIDYCLWGEKNGYAGSLSPKVHSFKIFNPERNEFYVSVVERMEKTSNRLKGEEDCFLINTLIHTYDRYKNTMSGLFLEELVPGITSFLNKLKEDFGRLDLHGGNIMVRNDGSVCITDPVTEGDGSCFYKKATRLRSKDIQMVSSGSPLS